MGGYVLQWGHRLSAMETGRRPSPRPYRAGSFNGATAFRRWKLVVAVAGVSLLNEASMGPPPFGDGNSPELWCRCPRSWLLQWGHRLSAMETGAAPARRRHAAAGFNGATAFRRWKRNTPYADYVNDPRLQWGHRLSAMETALCGSSAPWIHAKALFSRRIGYRINGHSVRDQLGFAAP